MSVCIIGAGMAGLCSGKYCLDSNLTPTIFEKTSNIGGTWVYTDKTGTDEYGLEIHSSMYQGLRTNLPKEVFDFPGFTFHDHEGSFVSYTEVYKFLVSYANHFKLHELIKFRHNVVNVRPHQNKWKVLVHDVINDKYELHTFDFVMVCNGHHFAPAFTEILDLEQFRGKSLHSHDYREPSLFKDETVLVIGVGPSGMDIALAASGLAKKVIVSHHSKIDLTPGLPEGVIQKPDCVGIRDGNLMEFADGSVEYVSFIVHCTGYHTLFPFLSVDSGITVSNNHVKLLYKHVINIKYPTMAFIGLNFLVTASRMIDTQVRFAVKFFSGAKALPSKAEMSEDTLEDIRIRKAKGQREKEWHSLGPVQMAYYDDLAQTADIEQVPRVVFKIFDDNRHDLVYDFLNFRKNVFRIINDDEYIKITP